MTISKSIPLIAIVFAFSAQSYAQLHESVEVCKNSEYEWNYLKTVTAAKCDLIIDGNVKNQAKETVTGLDVTLGLIQMVQCKDSKPINFSEKYYGTTENSEARAFKSKQEDFYSLGMLSTSGYWVSPSQHHYYEPNSPYVQKLWIEDNQKIQIVNKFTGNDWKNTATYNKVLKQLRVIHTRKSFFEKTYADVILQCN